MKISKSLQLRESIEKANILMKEKKWIEASAIWETVRTMSPDRSIGYIRGAISLSEQELYEDAISLCLDIDSRQSLEFILQILEKISSTKLYERAFLHIVSEKFTKTRPTVIVDKMHNLEVNNRKLYEKYIQKIESLNENNVDIDYFTLLALGLIQVPSLKYISELYLNSSLDILKKVFSIKKSHINNVKVLKKLNIFDQHSNRIIAKSFQEIYIDSTKNNEILQISKNTKLKIALCVSGQLRGYRDAFQSWKKFNFNEHELDIFCCVWKNIGRKKVNRTHLYRMFNQNFIDTFISYTEGMSDKKVANTFFNLYKYFETPELTTEEEIGKFYSAKKCKVMNDDAFQDKTNMYKMHYMIEECWNLIDNPDEYDLIIRFRPDKELKFFENNWNSILEISKQNKVIVNGDGPFISAGIGLAIGDQFAVGTPKVMKEYSKTFSSILSEKGVFSQQNYPGFRAHMSLYLQMIDKGIDVVGLDKVVFGNLLDPQKISNITVKDLIEKDLKGNLQKRTTFLNAIMEDMKNEKFNN